MRGREMEEALINEHGRLWLLGTSGGECEIVCEVMSEEKACPVLGSWLVPWWMSSLQNTRLERVGNPGGVKSGAPFCRQNRTKYNGGRRSELRHTK